MRYTFHCPMRWGDMDAYGHVNNVNFLVYLEEARIEMFAQLTSEVGIDAIKSGVVVAHSEIHYKRPLVHRTAPVPIDLWVTKIGGASFTLEYEVHDDDVLYARASSVLVPYDFPNERPRRLTPGERDFLERYLETDAGSG
jgi:acyl-CoA thioester hydrolase